MQALRKPNQRLSCFHLKRTNTTLHSRHRIVRLSTCTPLSLSLSRSKKRQWLICLQRFTMHVLTCKKQQKQQHFFGLRRGAAGFIPTGRWLCAQLSPSSTGSCCVTRRLGTSRVPRDGTRRATEPAASVYARRSAPKATPATPIPGGLPSCTKHHGFSLVSARLKGWSSRWKRRKGIGLQCRTRELKFLCAFAPTMGVTGSYISK